MSNHIYNWVSGEGQMAFRIGNLIDHKLRELLPKHGLILGETERAKLALDLGVFVLELMKDTKRFRSGRRIADKVKDKLLDLMKWLP